MNEKRNKFGELSPKEIQEITDNTVPETAKRPYSSECEYSIVRIRYVSRWKLQNFKYEHWDFTPSWRLRNNNNFYLIVTEWLATPCGTKFLKPIEEMSKEELNVFLKRFCTSARKKDRTLTKGHQWNPSKSRHWSFPSRSLPLNKPFSFISDPAFTDANKALKHLQKTSEKRTTLPTY